MIQSEHTKMIHSYAESWIQTCDLIQNKIPKSKRFHLPNIGVTYRDKLEEITQLYQEKGLSFYTSSLSILIRRYLEHFVEGALHHLQQGVTCIEYASIQQLILPNQKPTVRKQERWLKRYHELNQQIDSFDLEMNWKDLIAYDLELWNQLEKKGSPNLYREMGFSTLYSYNQELRQLGYGICSYTFLGTQYYRDNLARMNLQIQTQIYFQLHHQPILAAALHAKRSERIMQAMIANQNQDYKLVNELIENLLAFHIEKEIVESVEHYRSNNCSTITMEAVKAELVQIQQENLIFQIEKGIQKQQGQRCVNQ